MVSGYLRKHNILDREAASTHTMRWEYAWSFKEQQEDQCGWSRVSEAGR